MKCRQMSYGARGHTAIRGGVWGSSKCTLLQLLHQMTPILSVLRTQSLENSHRKQALQHRIPIKDRKEKPNSPFSLITGPRKLSFLGPIKQECRSQIKPEATEKTSPAGGLAQPGGELVKKKNKLGLLSPSLTSPPLPPNPAPEGRQGALGGLPPPPRRGNRGRRLIRCLHPIYVLFVKALFQLQPGQQPLALHHASQSYFTAPGLVSLGQNAPIIILALPLPL